MVTTRTYEQLGQRSWCVHVLADNGDEAWASVPKILATAELSTLPAAKRWARAALTHWRTHRPDGYWIWAHLVAGNYVDDSFTDEEYGPVRHARWQPSDTDRYSTWLTDTGQIRFQEGLL